MATRQPMSAGYAAKRILQAVFIVVMVAGAAAYNISGLAVFIFGLVGFVLASFIPAKT